MPPENTAPPQACANCVYSTVVENDKHSTMRFMRICRRYPPVFHPGDKRRTEWPLHPPVKDIDWCGEWSYVLPTPLPEITTPGTVCEKCGQPGNHATKLGLGMGIQYNCPNPTQPVTVAKPDSIATKVAEAKAGGARNFVSTWPAGKKATASAVHEIAAETLGEMAQPVTPSTMSPKTLPFEGRVIYLTDIGTGSIECPDGRYQSFTTMAKTPTDLTIGQEVRFEMNSGGEVTTIERKVGAVSPEDTVLTGKIVSLTKDSGYIQRTGEPMVSRAVWFARGATSNGGRFLSQEEFDALDAGIDVEYILSPGTDLQAYRVMIVTPTLVTPALALPDPPAGGPVT